MKSHLEKFGFQIMKWIDLQMFLVVHEKFEILISVLYKFFTSTTFCFNGGLNEFTRRLLDFISGLLLL